MKINKRGISLITLTISIIIMVILGTTIVITIGTSGSIIKSHQAKKDTNVSVLREALEVEISNANMEAVIREHTLKREDLTDANGVYKIDELEEVSGGEYRYKGKEVYIGNDLQVAVGRIVDISSLKAGDIIKYKTVAGTYNAPSYDTGVIETQRISTRNEYILCVVLEKLENGKLRIVPLNVKDYLVTVGFVGWGKADGSPGFFRPLDEISSLYLNSEYAESSLIIGKNNQIQKDTDLIKSLYQKGYHNVLGINNSERAWIGVITPNTTLVTMNNQDFWDEGIKSIYLPEKRYAENDDFLIKIFKSDTLSFEEPRLYNATFGPFYMDKRAVVPVITLKADLKVCGVGTEMNPFVIVDD